MNKFCIHEQHGGVCDLTDTYCNLGACPHEEIKEFAPVRHGRWLWNALAKPFCSECGVETWIASNFALPNYCQHCGARMDGAK